MVPDPISLMIRFDSTNLLFSQESNKTPIRLLLWDMQRDEFRELLRLPIKRFASQQLDFACVSPNHRYLLFTLAALHGDGNDLWLANLRERDTELIMANCNIDLTIEGSGTGKNACIWTANRAIIGGTDENIVVDLARMRAKYLDLTLPEGSAQ